MPRWGCVFIVLIALAGAAAAQNGLPANTLGRVKAATVLVRSPGPAVAGRPARTTGSGFLVHRRGELGYVVTNRHVIDHAQGSGDLTIVLDSGTERERVLAAEVLVADAENDLALLQVTAPDLPRPLGLATGAPRETATVYLCGFPFGEALGLDERNPGVTIAPATISSLRHDTAGQLARIQISGDINPGNSGGPVVDERGQVVAVALARVAGTQIGMVVPQSAVAQLLEAQVTHVTFEPLAHTQKLWRYEVAAHVVDPLEQLRTVALLTAPATGIAADLDSVPVDEPVGSSMDECQLKLAGAEARGELALPAGGAGDSFVFQVRYATRSGAPRYTPPQEFRPGQVAVPTPDPGVQPPPTPSAATTSQPARPPAAPDTDWLGGPQQQRRQQAHASGAPFETGSSLAGRPRNVADARFTPLTISGRAVARTAWVDEGHVAVLERGGVLRRVAVPALVEERQFLLGQSCSDVFVSGAGIVVVADGGELWVFEKSTLDLSRKLMVPELREACGARGVSTIVMTTRDGAVQLIDAATGQSGPKISRAALAAEPPVRGFPEGSAPGQLTQLAMPAHGQLLLAESGHALQRFRVAAERLLYEERGPVLGEIAALAVSADSRYVAAVGPRALDVPAHVPSASGGVYVYKVTDLRVPVLELTAVGAPTAFAFDRAGGRVYVGTGAGELKSFTADGAVGTTYATRGQTGGAVRQLLVHPGGGRLLCLTDEELSWVELPD